MKYLFISHSYYPARKMGGPLHSVRGLAETLVRQGHEVTVAAGNVDVDEPLDLDTGIYHWVKGVRVRYFKMRPPLLKRLRVPGFRHTVATVCGADWKAWIQENIDSFDVVDIHICFLSFAPLAVKLAKQNGVVLLYHQRGVLDPLRLRMKRFRKMFYIRLWERPLMKRADCLVALTSQEIGFFRQAGLHNRVEVIPNGISVDYSSSAISPSTHICQMVSNLGSRITFFWMSRIHAIKGADLFTAAFIRLAMDHPDVCAILAGPDEVGLEAGLKRQVVEAGLTERFFFPGTLSGDDKLAVLRRSDVFVFPTETEGFSMVLLEALASGCAIITSPGAYFQQIQEFGAGMVVERSPEAYFEAMQKMLKEGRMHIEEFSTSGKELVSSHYSWEAIAQTYADLTHELCDSK